MLTGRIGFPCMPISTKQHAGHKFHKWRSQTITTRHRSHTLDQIDFKDLHRCSWPARHLCINEPGWISVSYLPSSTPALRRPTTSCSIETMRTLLLASAFLAGLFGSLAAAPTPEPAPSPYRPFCRTLWWVGFCPHWLLGVWIQVNTRNGPDIFYFSFFLQAFCEPLCWSQNRTRCTDSSLEPVRGDNRSPVHLNNVHTRIRTYLLRRCVAFRPLQLVSVNPVHIAANHTSPERPLGEDISFSLSPTVLTNGCRVTVSIHDDLGSQSVNKVLSYGFKCEHIVRQTLFTRSLNRQRPTPLDSPVFSTVDSTTATSATCCQVSSASSHHVNGLLQAGCCNVKVTIHFGWSVCYVVNEWAATLLDSNLKCRDTFVILDKAGTWNDLTCSCWSLWMDVLQPPASPQDRASWRWPMNGLAWASDSPPVKSRGALMVK